MATRTKINFWRPDGGWGKAYVDGEDGKGSVFVHYTVVEPRPNRGSDLTDQEIVVDGVNWKAAKGPRAEAVFTLEEWERREARRLAAERKAAAEAARKLTVGDGGFLCRGGKPVTDWSVIRLVQRHHSQGKPDRIEAAEVSGEHYRWADKPITGQQLEELIEMGMVFRRTCAACRRELLTVDKDRQVHNNNRCDEGNNQRRWENLVTVVEKRLGTTLSAKAEFEAKWTKPLTLLIRVGERMFSSEELLADRCPKCGDRLEIEEEDRVKFDICSCGYRAKRFPAVREVRTARGHYWWEVLFRDPADSHDRGYGWEIGRHTAVAADYTHDFPTIEVREQLVRILREAGAPEEVIAAARPIEPDPTASHVCPECGVPVVSRYKARREGRFYSVKIQPSSFKDDDGKTHYYGGGTLTSGDVKSGTYWVCPHGHGTWWDERSVLNPRQ